MIDEVFNQWRNWMHTHAFSVSSPHINPNINYQQTRGFSRVNHDDKEFRVRLDVNHFSPEEITVKTVENRVLIHAKHEERQDEHGFIQREFTRQYLLPRECDPNSVTSTLSSDGFLTIRAPKTLPANGNERVIPITQEVTEA